MCKSRMCTELGTDPANWSRQALLPPPDWFRAQLEVFSLSVRAAAEGRIEPARKLLAHVLSDDLREWFVEHGAQSGRLRSYHFRDKRASLPTGLHRHQRPGAALQRQVLERDFHRCRYCGIGLISKKILVDFGDVLGITSFRERTDSGRHGALMSFRANFDHVVAAWQGGSTDPSNLVSCCWTCNYRKRSLSLADVGLEDPRLRDPVSISGWDGLVSIAPALSKVASLQRRQVR